MIYFLLTVLIVYTAIIIWLASEADRWRHIAEGRKDLNKEYRQLAEESTNLAIQQHKAILDLQEKYGIRENKDSGS